MVGIKKCRAREDRLNKEGGYSSSSKSKAEIEGQLEGEAGIARASGNRDGDLSSSQADSKRKLDHTAYDRWVFV